MPRTKNIRPQAREQASTSAKILPTPVTRTLKRTASIASLPTPPRTRKRPHKDTVYSSPEYSDSPSESEDDSDDVAHKPVVAGTVSAFGDEDAFWGGAAGPEHKRTAQNQLGYDSDEDECSSPSLAPHLARKSQLLMSGASSLASPPPSHRRVVKSSGTSLLSPFSLGLPTTSADSCFGSPVTAAQDMWDTDENPFLDGPSGKQNAPNTDSSPGPTLEEQPSLTYVYRGKRVLFVNPYFQDEARARRSSSTSAASKRHLGIPVQHPDYSPDPGCPPRRLFTQNDRMDFPDSYASDEEESDDELVLGSCGGGVSRRLFTPLQHGGALSLAA